MKTLLKYKREIMILALGIFLLSLLPKRCTTQPLKEPKITIVRDTVWQTKIDTFQVQTTQYETVYVTKNSPTKIIKDTVFVKDSTEFIKAKI